MDMTNLRRPANPRVAIVSDTVDDINGVAIGLRRLVAAGKAAGFAVDLIGAEAPANAEGRAHDTVIRVPAAMRATLPFYAGMTWSVPAIPALVAVLRNYDLVQLATPGPMGVAALVAARMLQLPVIGQYHTEVAAYAARMTGLPFLEGIVSPIVGWFYQQVDLCLAPSEAVAARLVALGIPATRIKRVRRGVDLALFDPAHRDRRDDAPTALYVGRLSTEKGIDTLARAWTIVRDTIPTARLVVVGDGPRTLVGAGIEARGTLHGAALAREFASADVFAFPSETETFGNVVVEAAASGLPVVVSPKGASHEHVIDGVTGLVADGVEATAAAIIELLGSPARRTVMARAARAHARGYDMDHAVASTWRIYRDVIRATALEVAS